VRETRVSCGCSDGDGDGDGDGGPSEAKAELGGRDSRFCSLTRRTEKKLMSSIWTDGMDDCDNCVIINNILISRGPRLRFGRA
jgi:hypothetical protein